MAHEDRIEKFVAAREEVLNNLSTIQMTIEECTEDGMSDPNSRLYNQVIDLISQAQTAKDVSELDLAITKGKDIEAMVDEWLAEQGTSSYELTWPDLSKI